MRTLITGGAGYIGSHVAVALHEAGHEPVLLDTMQNAPEDRGDRLAELLGTALPLERVDVRDTDAVREVIEKHDVEAVVHCAGLKSAPGSVAEPVAYWDTNVAGTVSLLKAMQPTRARSVVFSSSATVYGDVDGESPETRTHLTQLTPYGRTKFTCEQIMTDVATSDPSWRFALLRYFNPIGAHPSALIGDSPKGTPGNIMPILLEVADGTREHLMLTGTDFATPDGTGVRDYFHVMDLAEGHVQALEHVADRPGAHIWNLGSGRGASVIELADAFERATGVTLRRVEAPRRPGDVAVSLADISLAKKELSYSPKRTLEDACADAWRFRQQTRTTA